MPISKNKIIILLVVLCLILGLGAMYYSGQAGDIQKRAARLETSHQREAAEFRSKIAQLEQETERLLVQRTDRARTITTVETRPDGTRIETTDQQKEITKVLDRATDKSKETRREEASSEEKVSDTMKAVADTKSQYQVGAYYDFGIPQSLESYGVDVGYRLGRLPAFLTLGYKHRNRDFTLGVRVEW